MRVPRYLLRTSVTVEPYAGDSASGPVYGTAVPVRGHWEGKRRLYMDRDGRQAISSAVFIVDLHETVPVESRIVKDAEEFRAVSVIRNDAGLEEPEHLEIILAPFRLTGKGVGS